MNGCRAIPNRRARLHCQCEVVYQSAGTTADDHWITVSSAPHVFIPFQLTG
jgi:hypothetical protein